MNKFEFKNLTPFKWFVLENFPFIEADFDALTDWQLFCKLGKEINKIINSENILGTQMENVINAFIELQNYVNNYFDNLDVQEEINNKLDQMAQDGTLDNIINNNIFNDLNNKIINIEENLDLNSTTIMIGDSYGVGTTNETEIITGWCDLLKQKMNLSDDLYYKFVENGSGFIATGVSGNNFLSLLQQNTIEDKSLVKNIIVCGGYNDRNSNQNTIESAISSFMNYVKSNFPNATVYVGMIGNDGKINATGSDIRTFIAINVLPAYKNIFKYGGIYLEGVETCMKYYPLFSNDGYHPNQNGYNELANFIYNAFKSGCCYRQTSTLGSNIGTNQGLYYNMLTNGNVTQMVIVGDSILPAFTAGEELDLGLLNNCDNYRQSRSFSPIIPCTYFLEDTSGKVYGGTGFMYVNTDNHLRLYNRQLKQDGTPWLVFQNIKKIHIYECSITFPTCFA